MAVTAVKGLKSFSTYRVCEVETRMTDGHVLEESIYLATGKAAPGANHPCPRLCFLQAVLRVQVIKNELWLSVSWMIQRRRMVTFVLFICWHLVLQTWKAQRFCRIILH